MNHEAFKTLVRVISTYPNLLTPKNGIGEAVGHSPEDLANYGLDQKTLKRLERMGLAIRAYDPRADGRRTRWILVGEET